MDTSGSHPVPFPSVGELYSSTNPLAAVPISHTPLSGGSNLQVIVAPRIGSSTKAANNDFTNTPTPPFWTTWMTKESLGPASVASKAAN